MSLDALRDQSRRYYEARLDAHGATPAGVDWNSQASQELRFQQLARLWEADPDASVLDYGCGYGALASYLRAHGHRGPYRGFDVSERMADEASKFLERVERCQVTSVRGTLQPADFAAASGVFNVKQDADDGAWSGYIREVLAELAALGSRGFAFNALTIHSDVDRRRPHLYYADPLELLEYCRSTYSRHVALLQDYPLYECTIIVRHLPAVR